MSYPQLPIVRSSMTRRLSGIAPARARNGLLKVRRLYTADKIIFDVVHQLSDAQKAQLEAAYQANRLANLTLAWPADGVSYTVRFGSAPLHMLLVPGCWESSVQLLEV